MSVNESIRMPVKLKSAWDDAIMRLCPPALLNKLKDKNRRAQLHTLLRENKAGIQHLWNAYNLERSTISKLRTTTKSVVFSYLLGFHQSNTARILASIRRATSERGIGDLINEFSDIQVVDLGCGTGAAAAVWAHELSNRGKKFSVSLYDRSSAFLDASVAVLRGLVDEKVEVSAYDIPLERCRPSGLQKSVGTRAVILNAAYVWNEIITNKAAMSAFMEIMEWGAQASNPILLHVVDSAKDKISRGAMEFRDDLVKMGWTPVYPCPSSSACPMLERKRDWCFSEFKWQQDEASKAVDELLGTDRTDLTTSAYMFVNQRMQKRFKYIPNAAVVVGRPVISRRGEEEVRRKYLACKPRALVDVPTGEKADKLRGEILSRTTK